MFRANPMTVAAAERKLQVISEAAIRLGGEAEQRIPASPLAGYQRDRKSASPLIRTDRFKDDLERRDGRPAALQSSGAARTESAAGYIVCP